MKYVTDPLRRLAYLALFPFACSGLGLLFLVTLAVVFAITPLLWLVGGWPFVRKVWLTADSLADISCNESPAVTVHKKLRWILP